MAEASYPYTTLSAAQWRDLMRVGMPEGVINWGLSGFGLDLSVLQDTGSNMNIKVSPGEAMVFGVYYSNSTDKILTVPSNATGSTRLDRVVLRLDTVAATCEAVVKVGTTSAPSITYGTAGVFEIPLALISVANGASAIATANITDERRIVKVSAEGPQGYHAHATLAVATAYATTSGINFCSLSNVRIFPLRRYKITGHVPSLRGGTGFSGNGGVFQVRLFRDADQLAAANVRLRSTDAAEGSDGAHITYLQDGLASGKHAYNLQIIRVDGNGEASVYAGANSPAILLIEDIGSSLV